MKVICFSKAIGFRERLQQPHATATELFGGIFKKGANKSGLTYPAAVRRAIVLFASVFARSSFLFERAKIPLLAMVHETLRD